MAFALVGQTVEHFELLAPLGAGAMSEVYLGRDTRLDKQVAVKVINENLLRRPDLVERFEREAQAAARLSHPNVATVYFFGNFQGKPFYAMELIRGWSLGEIVEHRVGFTWEQLLGLFAQAAVGLQAAHDAGVLHRDIKPGNLMANESGILKIVDFGLAKLGDDKSLTRSGAMMGTPYYIAPEVVQGQGSDHLSDIYSLGVTMFHNLSGRPPFDAETPYGVMMQHISEPAPSLRALNPQVPAALSDLVEVMMAKEPVNRPQTYASVAIALRGIADEMGPERLSRSLVWCHFDKANTETEAGRCAICKRPRGARELPEIFHVDLVGWHRNDAVDAVAGYIAQAVGQSPDEIRTLLDPLPFRAAFRVPRERARRMQRTFYDLGADVSLAPADDDAEGQGAPKELPFRAHWPQEARSSTSNVTHTGARVARLKPRRRGLELSPPVLLSVVLTILLLLMVGVQVGRELGPQAPTPQPQAPTPQPAATPLASASPQEPTPRPDLPPPDAAPPEARTPSAEATPVEEAPPPPVEQPEEVREPPSPTPRSTDRVRLSGDPGPVDGDALLRAFDDAAARVDDLLRLPSTDVLEVRLVDRPFDGWPRAVVRPVIEFPTRRLALGDLGHAAEELTMRAAIQRASGGHAPVWLSVGLGAWLSDGPAPRDSWPDIAARSSTPTELTSMLFLASPENRDSVRAFASWLVEEKGWSRITFLLGYLEAGQDLDVATRRAMGDTTFAEMQRFWLAEAGAGE